jgi:hypothetical protein
MLEQRKARSDGESPAQSKASLNDICLCPKIVIIAQVLSGKSNVPAFLQVELINEVDKRVALLINIRKLK